MQTFSRPPALPKRKPSAPSHAASDLAALATNDVLRDWDPLSGRLVWAQNFEASFGYPAELIESEIGFWQRNLHPADRARIVASLKNAFASETDRWSGEYRFRAANGDFLLLFERAFIERDDAGRATRFVGSLMDITARRQLQDQVARSQRMEAFGQLAGGVAHDFNNFLTAIVGYADLIAAEGKGRGSIASYINEVRHAATRAATLTRQLLAFSRRQPLEPRVVEINGLVSNLDRSVLRLLGENISVFCEHTNKPIHLKVDPQQFTQIIVNLAVNARDAMPNGGTLQLKLATLPIAEDPARPEIKPGNYIRISIIDDGVGMTNEIKEHIFEPFFTTKGERDGTGLGLATCYGIVRQSGGFLTLESELGEGTSVHVFLPVVPAPPASAQRKPRLDRLPNGHESVLVVEDDRSVRHVAVRTLRLLGYDVVEALTADEGKRQIGKKLDRFHLVVADIMLPDMSGRAFAEWARKHAPQTRVVLVSGYLESTQTGESDDLLFLPKPFDPEQLALTVRAALDGRAPV